jgi:hypothetical protein
MPGPALSTPALFTNTPACGSLPGAASRNTQRAPSFTHTWNGCSTSAKRYFSVMLRLVGDSAVRPSLQPPGFRESVGGA